MGGRGGASSFSKKNAVLDPKAKEQVIETYFRRKGAFGAHYGDSAYEAKAGENGELILNYATAHFTNPKDQSNTQDVTFTIKHGAVQHFNSGATEFYGINWDNVKSVSGQTYGIKDHIKDHGFRWSGKDKKWVKK